MDSKHYVSFIQGERKVTLVIIKSILQGIKSLFKIMTKFSKCTFKITYVIANLKFSMHGKIYLHTQMFQRENWAGILIDFIALHMHQSCMYNSGSGVETILVFQLSFTSGAI